MLYLLNSPIMTSAGTWRMSNALSPTEIMTIANTNFISCIGHESSAMFFSLVIGKSVPVNRISAELKTGDLALVLRLKVRLPEGKVLTKADLGKR